METSAVIILSGGMDSSVLAYKLKSEFDHLKAITFNYGQKHALREISAAKSVADHLKVEHKIVDLCSITELFGSSSLTNKSEHVPDGHYTAESMKSTVVPNRNMIMLSIAAAWAMSLKFKYLAYAAHSGDHTIYPDCRPEFAEALGKSLKLADWHEVELLNPFVNLNKGQICGMGAKLGVDFSRTWSCYKGGDKHCGKCGTCVERIEAFKIAEIKDPTDYLS